MLAAILFVKGDDNDPVKKKYEKYCLCLSVCLFIIIFLQGHFKHFTYVCVCASLCASLPSVFSFLINIYIFFCMILFLYEEKKYKKGPIENSDLPFVCFFTPQNMPSSHALRTWNEFDRVKIVNDRVSINTEWTYPDRYEVMKEWMKKKARRQANYE